MIRKDKGDDKGQDKGEGSEQPRLSEEFERDVKKINRKRGRQAKPSTISLSLIAKPEEDPKHKSFSFQDPKSSFVDLFKYRSLRRITICLAILNACQSFIFIGIIIYVDKLGVDITYNAIWSGAAQFLAFLSLKCILGYPRKHVVLQLCIVILVASIGFVWITMPEEC